MIECIDCMDADGAFRHFPCPGSRREQPAYDMQVLRAARSAIVDLRNRDIKGGMGHGKK